MKRQLKQIVQLTIAFSFIAIIFSACEGAEQEIFRDADTQMKQETDEENEKKAKPGIIVKQL